MDTDKVAEIICAEGDKYRKNNDLVAWGIISSQLSLIDALAGYFEREMRWQHNQAKPHDCSANCYFNAYKFKSIATGESDE